MPEATAEAPALNSVPPISSRDRILYAGKRLFARNGYENTSTVAIAREAGTSESQLMKHFGSKQGLLAAILDCGWDSVIHRVRSAQNEGPVMTRLVGALEAMVSELENDPQLKELVTLEACRIRKDNHDVVMSQGYRQFSELIGTLLQDMRGKGELPGDVNLDALCAALMGTAEGLLRGQVVASRSQARRDYTLTDMRKVLEVLVAAFGAASAQPLRVVNG